MSHGAKLPFLHMDTLGIEPRAFRMRSGCDTTTPCAPVGIQCHFVVSAGQEPVLLVPGTILGDAAE